MSDLFCSNVNPVIFFIYIGFNIAAFAFLCQYLIFPKSLLADLSNMICEKPPRITDNSVVNQDDYHVNRIICFFFEIDAITYTILTYIIYSVAVVLAILSVYFRIVPSYYAKCLAILFLGIYIIIICYVVYATIIKKDNRAAEIRRNSYWTSRYWYAFFEFLYLFFLSFGVICTLLVLDKAMALFLFLIFVLVCLFGWYIVCIALRTPVRNILALWIHNRPCGPQEK